MEDYDDKAGYLEAENVCDVGIFLSKLDAENDWDKLPESLTEFAPTVPNNLPASIEAIITAKRIANAAHDDGFWWMSSYEE